MFSPRCSIGLDHVHFLWNRDQVAARRVGCSATCHLQLSPHCSRDSSSGNAVSGHCKLWIRCWSRMASAVPSGHMATLQPESCQSCVYSVGHLVCRHRACICYVSSAHAIAGLDATCHRIATRADSLTDPRMRASFSAAATVLSVQCCKLVQRFDPNAASISVTISCPSTCTRDCFASPLGVAGCAAQSRSWTNQTDAACVF